MTSLAAPIISNLVGDVFEFGGVLTIIGLNFGTTAQDTKVVLNGTISGNMEAQVLNVSNSQLVCSVPAGPGRQLTVSVWIGPTGHAQVVSKVAGLNDTGKLTNPSHVSFSLRISCNC